MKKECAFDQLEGYHIKRLRMKIRPIWGPSLYLSTRLIPPECICKAPAQLLSCTPVQECDHGD
ncbi:hypothetical protein OUZ56_004863 [Daphnia magna]|uniref:Uncharacterized protein n=1 Tax=Daphnia magna TaxID=35525 RepID=A0ABQ9YR29_9CRUS|nr:hypothetical protein OUZ56_004863 [Daphnia magna]